MPIIHYPIPDFPGYTISRKQDVYSWLRRGKRNQFFIGDTFNKLSTTCDGYGYLGLTLRRGGVSHRKRVHRLMLETFVGPCPDGHGRLP